MYKLPNLIYGGAFEAIAATLSDEVYKHSVFDRDRKIVRAGTFLSGDFLRDKSKRAVANYDTDDVVAILLNDADITNGPVPIAALVKGHVKLGMLDRKPTALIEERLPQIKFHASYKSFNESVTYY